MKTSDRESLGAILQSVIKEEVGRHSPLAKEAGHALLKPTGGESGHLDHRSDDGSYDAFTYVDSADQSATRVRLIDVRISNNAPQTQVHTFANPVWSFSLYIIQLSSQKRQQESTFLFFPARPAWKASKT